MEGVLTYPQTSLAGTEAWQIKVYVYHDARSIHDMIWSFAHQEKKNTHTNPSASQTSAVAGTDFGRFRSLSGVPVVIAKSYGFNLLLASESDPGQNNIPGPNWKSCTNSLFIKGYNVYLVALRVKVAKVWGPILRLPMSQLFFCCCDDVPLTTHSFRHAIINFGQPQRTFQVHWCGWLTIAQQHWTKSSVVCNFT